MKRIKKLSFRVSSNNSLLKSTANKTDSFKKYYIIFSIWLEKDEREDAGVCNIFFNNKVAHQRVALIYHLVALGSHSDIVRDGLINQRRIKEKH